MNYQVLENRLKPAGGAERANYGLFLQDLCALLGVPHPDSTTDNLILDTYVLERTGHFNDGGKKSLGHIDRGCFVLETKQGTDSLDLQQKAQRDELGLPPEKRRKGHTVRSTTMWAEMMQNAHQQALRYVRALPATESFPLSPSLSGTSFACPSATRTPQPLRGCIQSSRLLVSCACNGQPTPRI